MNTNINKQDSYQKPNQINKIQRIILIYFLYSFLISNVITTTAFFIAFLADYVGMIETYSNIYSILFELIMMLIVSCVLFKLVRINSTIKKSNPLKCWAFAILISFLFNLIYMPINILVFHRKTWDYIYCK